MENHHLNFQDLREEDNEDFLTLSLSTGPKPSPPAPPAPPSSPCLVQEALMQPTYLRHFRPPSLSPQHPYSQPFPSIPQAPPLPPYHNYQTQTHNPNQNNALLLSQEIPSHARPPRFRRNPFQTPRQGKPETVPPPYPWATAQRAMVHSLDYLLSRHMTTISGEVQCKKCDKVYNIEYDLQQKFNEIASFISKNKFAMHDRAPADWMNPNLPSCESCGSCLKPVVSKKRCINWLFLFLGQMLGCCKLSELKYFCKHTKNHRTGAKDRVLYLTYLGLCKQLDPKGPF